MFKYLRSCPVIGGRVQITWIIRVRSAKNKIGDTPMEWPRALTSPCNHALGTTGAFFYYYGPCIQSWLFNWFDLWIYPPTIGGHSIATTD